MNNSTLNFTTADTSTTFDFGLVDSQGMSVFSISLLFGLPTHSYVIWLIITGTGSGVASEFFNLKSGVASEFFNLNLSVCEIGNSLNAMFGILSYFYLNFTNLTIFFARARHHWSSSVSVSDLC